MMGARISVQERRTHEIDVAWDVMAWTVPRYSRGEVDRAGKALVTNAPSKTSKRFFLTVSQDVLDVVNNWRSSHLLPLYVLRTTLERRAKKISNAAIVAERIKRFASIEQKLIENQHRNLRLSQIEDIGGCRAVMPTIREAYALLENYADRGINAELFRLRDYIKKPKPDGYRSIHLVYKYSSDRDRYRIYNGHRIEIQIRSKLQHAWATAVEMLLTFAGISVKLGASQPVASPPRSPWSLAIPACS